MSGESPARRLARAAAAAIVGALTLAIFHRTMYPGLVPFSDSPKMQFVGRIWGTPHNPGYPLFVVVSHAFGLIPIGTLAYRINFMSAVFGALACAGMTLVVTRVTGRVWAGVAAGLALGFGRVFWSQSIVAEVYALAAALLTATIAFTLRWIDTRRPRDLLAAVACAALAVGNHLTIVMFAPGLIVMVLATDWRSALRPRRVIAMTAIVLAGLSQYLLILYWTHRGAPYLETTARSLPELLSVVSGGQFHSWLGHFTWRELATIRMAYVADIVAEELRPWGLALVLPGVFIVARRRPAVAAGLLVSAACVWGFALDYDVKDTAVFLIPVIVVGWIFAGAGAAAIVDLAASRMPSIAAAGWLVPAGVAAALLAANYRISDHHSRTYEITMLNDVLLTVPARTAVVPAKFSDELMLTYKMFGEGAAHGRDLVLVPAKTDAVKEASRAGRPVYAMSAIPEDLAGNGFVFEPVPLFTTLKDGRREPFGTDPVLFRLTDIHECRDIANRGWVDISDTSDRRYVVARLDNYRAFDSQLWIVAGRENGSRSALSSFSGPERPTARSTTISSDPAAAVRALTEAGAAPPALPPAPVVDVLRLQVDDHGDFEIMTIDLGTTPRFLWALATADLQNPRRLRICSGDVIH